MRAGQALRSPITMGGIYRMLSHIHWLAPVRSWNPSATMRLLIVSPMSDSSGSTTYQYDQLSHLTSETRTFSGLGGSYTLGYDYHIGGQLKSITDHTNQRINYAYDNAGRLNALTGTNYTDGQFINNISYRAWGGPRQISYGNGRTESVAYNSRLKATHYEIPAGGSFATAASIDYQYYDDGRLKYSHDLIDSRFDRSFEYDHAARLTKALSEPRPEVNRLRPIVPTEELRHTMPSTISTYAPQNTGAGYWRSVPPIPIQIIDALAGLMMPKVIC